MPILSTTFVGQGVAPRVEFAQALSPTVVLVQFSEPMEANAALLDPANYAITEDLGSDPRAAIAATRGLASQVVLTLDGSLTPGTANYNVAVPAAFVDLAGNTMDLAALDADFDGVGGPSALVTHKDGGELLTVSAPGALDGEYHIHVGPLGSIADPPLYSGISGQGRRIVVANEEFLGAMPPLPVGGPYAFTLVNLSTGLVTTSAPALTVLPGEFRSGTLRVRGLLAPPLDAGLRDLKHAPYPQ